MPLQATSGAASYDAFGGGVPAVPQYIEDVFSTYLYTGNGSTQTITNGIDLSGQGGLVWLKNRTGGSGPHNWYTTDIGSASYLDSSQTSGLVTYQEALSTYNSDGFSLSSGAAGGNENTFTYASWTFRKQPKFFDVVAWTGTGANRTISHSLGSVPGCIMVKRTDTTADWQVYHRSNANTQYMVLNTTASTATGATRWNSTTPTDTVFSLGTDVTVNASGGTYVAYVFAHNAGGFGLTGTDNVISCGSYTGNGNTAGNAITLGYEPQWILIKARQATRNWVLFDTTRGMPVSGIGQRLNPNLSAIENDVIAPIPTATGFTFNTADDTLNADLVTYVYIAIRRGPMKVPTDGTKVFGLSARTGTGANATVTGSAGVSDAVLIKNRGSAVGDIFAARLTNTTYLVTSTSLAEVGYDATVVQAVPWDVMDGFKVGTTSTRTNASANTFINYLFDRAPSFFDVVCYTGTGVQRTVTHNLTVIPELIIVKLRSAGASWAVGTQFGASKYTRLSLDTANAASLGAQNADYTSSLGFAAQPTLSTFTVDTTSITNFNGGTYVSYLFATCAGVSKVGSYTGTATTLQVDCGFTAGARFVLIKRTDSTGDWYVWDTARGIVSGNDPYFLLNSTAAEVTSTDYIDTYSAGFEISSTAPAAINASGGTFIFLAIA